MQLGSIILTKYDRYYISQKPQERSKVLLLSNSAVLDMFDFCHYSLFCPPQLIILGCSILARLPQGNELSLICVWPYRWVNSNLIKSIWQGGVSHLRGLPGEEKSINKVMGIKIVHSFQSVWLTERKNFINDYLVTNLVTEFINTGWNNTAFPEQEVTVAGKKKNISPATILIFLYKSISKYTLPIIFLKNEWLKWEEL